MDAELRRMCTEIQSHDNHHIMGEDNLLGGLLLRWSGQTCKSEIRMILGQRRHVDARHPWRR